MSSSRLRPRLTWVTRESRAHTKRVFADLYSSESFHFSPFSFLPRSVLYYFVGIVFRRYPVTRMRNRLSTRGWMQPVVHNRSRAYKRRQKANRQWTARFRLESYQSLSGHNPTSATCYLLYALGYRDPPFVAPWLITIGDPWGSIRHRYPWSTYIHASNMRERFYCMSLCVYMCALQKNRAEYFSPYVLKEDRC